MNKKGYYRTEITRRIIMELEEKEDADAFELSKKVQVIDAVHLATEAWDQVTPSTIQACFKKCL